MISKLANRYPPELRELLHSNDILRQPSAYFAQAEPGRHWKK